ncbi:hypothetical protein ACIREO_22770 [Streptomyces sp. NPDC102441]|uniref:hypothetical protein n=1 Tax=Streptomyces sp. NPDC102441 TaxID=3366176 RepID=UPI00382D178E
MQRTIVIPCNEVPHAIGLFTEAPVISIIGERLARTVRIAVAVDIPGTARQQGRPPPRDRFRGREGAV